MKALNGEIIGYYIHSGKGTPASVISTVKDYLFPNKSVRRIMDDVSLSIGIRLFRIKDSETVRVLIIITGPNYMYSRLLFPIKLFEEKFQININDFEILATPMIYDGVTDYTIIEE